MAQMTQIQDSIDRAIDAVANRLTLVEDDSQFAARIVAALPERVTWFGWLSTSWAPRLAVIGLAAGVSVLLMNRQASSPAVLRSAPANFIATAALRATVEAWEPQLRTKPLEPLQPLQPLEPQPDHEFSLAALDVEALAPMNLPVDASIDLAPLAIADLPLSGEFPEKQ